ncbi:MAG: ZIP family metal transporter [Candidatus Pacebacteria bacterium]|nr:ZIP family metal transporter [Candidatus Paceibacterota bacterium]
MNITMILSALFISLTSFSGALFASQKAYSWLFEKKNIKFLITFSAGIFGTTAILLSFETFEMLSKTQALIAVISGFVFMLILHKLLPESHHHDTKCPNCEPKIKKTGIKILVGDTIHNIADGLVLISAFSVSKEFGFFVTISILIHEIIQEISEYFVLRDSGFSRKKALAFNFLSSLSIFVGILIGYVLIQNETIQAVLLGFSAGIFLHIVFHDLLPYHELQKNDTKNSWKHILVLCLGIGIMILINIATPHTHTHNDAEHMRETNTDHTHFEDEMMHEDSLDHHHID